MKLHEIPSSGRRVVPWGRTDGQTDMTKLIVAFRTFANAPEQLDRRKFLKLLVFLTCIHSTASESRLIRIRMS